MSESRTGSDDAIDQVLANLSVRRKEYALAAENENAKKSENVQKFRIAWEGTIAFAMNELDRRIAKLKERNIVAEISGPKAQTLGDLNNAPPDTVVDLRNAEVNGNKLDLRLKIYSGTGAAELMLNGLPSGQLMLIFLNDRAAIWSEKGSEWGCPDLTDTGLGAKRRNPMKTQIRKPSAGKSHYTTEYKQEALKHWKDSGRSAATVAAEFGLQARSPPLTDKLESPLAARGSEGNDTKA